MADLQIVFADNPTKESGWEPSQKGAQVKTSLQSQAETSKVKKKERSRMRSPAQRRNDIRLGKASRKRARAKRAAKKPAGSKKPNPYYFKGKKGKKTAKTGRFPSKSELKSWTRSTYQFEQRAKPGRKSKKAHKKKYAKRARVNKKIHTQLRRGPAARAKAVKKAAALRKKGYKIKKVYVSPKAVLATRKRKTKAKRKQSRKGSKVAKKRKKKATKRKSSKKRGKRRGAARRRSSKQRKVIYLRPKRKSVTIRWKKNSMATQLKEFTGLDATQFGGLLAGGALYGAVDRALARLSPAAYQTFFSIPVIGNALPALISGVALKYAAKKFLKISILETVAEGLIGAAAVAMGSQAGSGLVSSIPGLSGYGAVDFTRGPGVMNGYARDGADFGAVDYTPGMGQAPQLGMNAQMGRDPGNPDFGEIPQGLDGMGEIPLGLG